MRAALSLRLLCALILLGWGQMALAEDYYWTHSGSTIKYSSASAACSVYAAKQFQPNSSVQFGGTMTPMGNMGSFYCHIEICSGTPKKCSPPTPPYVVPYNSNSLSVARSGNGCAANTTYDPLKGSCIAPTPPKDCSAHKNKFIMAGVAGQLSGKVYTTPSTVSIDGARYVSAPDGKARCKSNFDGTGTALCAARYAGDGTCMAEGPSSNDLSKGSYVDVSAPESKNPNCMSFGGRELCLAADDKNCDVYQGQSWCTQSGETCGDAGNQFACYPEKARQCTYVNGKMECIQTGSPQGSKPPSYIPETSSDHPTNGGNADGNDRNDPKAPGSITAGSGGGPQGSDSAATNESLSELGDKIDDTNGLLGDIRDLLGEEYDNSGDGSDKELEGAGDSTGKQLAKAIEEQTASILEERDKDSNDFLKKLPSTVTNWFGDSGQKVGLSGVLNTILPVATNCAPYVLKLDLDRYKADLKLNVCELTRVKPLLEWVIWAVTLVGLWKILYAGLRQEDVKASKGGF
jgi:hypothetical protein